MKTLAFIWDLECYPNIFSFCGKFRGDDRIYFFEISDRINQLQELFSFLSWLRNLGNVEMVGFNNVGYDYPLLHELMTNPYTFTFDKAYEFSQKIIKSNGFYRGCPQWERYIPQIDLFKICHFDNRAKTTSLKALQFAMRSESLEDLPFAIRPLNDQEKDQLGSYNAHDVTETEKFLGKVEHHIEMRREYLADGTLTGDVLNFNDTKIGSEYMVNRIGKHKCFKSRKPRQTFREFIECSQIILPKIFYKTEEYNKVLSWFMKQIIYPGGKGNPTLEAQLAGLPFHFGVGGVHASADNKIFHTDDEYQIIDVDVAGMYPAVAITNGFAPEHLGESFVHAYRQVRDDRSRYAKGTAGNAVMKLACNGTYGNSSSSYSPFYDPKFTFSVTVNGQLQLLQLAEMLDLIPNCELIQANTDGVTIIIKKDMINLFRMWCKVWEEMTGLILEEVLYSRMLIKDVNNYIAEYMDGKLKRKGAYWYPIEEKDYDGWWNKDFSNLASKKAAEKAMLDSWPVESAIRLVTDPFDFMLRYKVPKTSQLYIGDTKQLSTVRYYVSKTGGAMKKVSPPTGTSGEFKRQNKLTDEFFNQIFKEIGPGVWDKRIHTKNKSIYETRISSVQSGWLLKECNVAAKFDWNDVDWNYYIEEAKKIIIGNK